MSNPSIQNDFSYYRRTLARIKTAQTPEAKAMIAAAVVKDDLANKMSLFYAYPTPMLKTLVDGMSTLTKSLPVDNITTCLSILVRICHCAVAEEKVTDVELVYFCLRVCCHQTFHSRTSCS